MITFKKYLEEADKKDTVTVDIPLLIRLLELAREDIKSDMDLHRVVERLIDIRNKGILTMDDYDFIAHIKEEFNNIVEDGLAGGTLAGSGNIAGIGVPDSKTPPVKNFSEPPGSRTGKNKKIIMMGMGKRKALE